MLGSVNAATTYNLLEMIAHPLLAVAQLDRVLLPALHLARSRCAELVEHLRAERAAEAAAGGGGEARGWRRPFRRWRLWRGRLRHGRRCVCACVLVCVLYAPQCVLTRADCTLTVPAALFVVGSRLLCAKDPD